MTQIEDRAAMPPGEDQAEGLEVRIARELLEQARTEGVSLVGRHRAILRFDWRRNRRKPVPLRFRIDESRSLGAVTRNQDDRRDGHFRR